MKKHYYFHINLDKAEIILNRNGIKMLEWDCDEKVTVQRHHTTQNKYDTFLIINSTDGYPTYIWIEKKLVCYHDPWDYDCLDRNYELYGYDWEEFDENMLEEGE